MKLENLEDLLVDQMEDLYDAENQLVDALPKMAKTASTPELKQSFEQHLMQTQGHVQRLEEAFQQLGMEPKSKTCKAMKGLIAEGSEMIKENAEPEVKDAGLIAAAQRVEHYEMAGYGCVRTYAEQLGKKSIASLFEQTLKEEEQTDKKLTQIATQVINRMAQHAGAAA